MQRIKSLFISLYVVFLLVATVYSAWQYFASEKQLLFMSTFLSVGLVSAYFAYLYLKRPSTVETFTLVITAATATLALITIGDRFYNNAVYNDAIWISITSFIGWMLYSGWYAKLKPTIALNVGDTFPKTDLKGPADESIDINSLEGKHKLVIFHRGNWCPFCVAQVEQLDERKAALEKARLTTIAISPVSPQWNNRLVNRLDRSIHMLIDQDNELSKQIGIFHRGNLPFGLQLIGFTGSSSFPTSMLLDQKNQIVHIHQSLDYRKRPSIEYWLRFVQK